MTRVLPWLVIAALAGVLLWSRNGVTDSQQREAIRVTDSVYVSDTVHLTRWRTQYDTLVKNLPKTFIVPAPVKEILQAADSAIVACEAVVRSCDARVAARDKRIKTLEGGRLWLYGEAGVRLPPSLIGARLEGEAGVALKLDRDLHLQAGATTGGDLRLTVRRQLRLF